MKTPTLILFLALGCCLLTTAVAAKDTAVPDVLPGEQAHNKQWIVDNYKGVQCSLSESQDQPPLVMDDENFDPTAPPAAPPQPKVIYRPTEYSVFTLCGGMGCIDDPHSDNPEVGICALPQNADDCAGAANPDEHDGLCGPAHVPMGPIDRIRAKRFMLTGAVFGDLLMDVPDKKADIDVTVGALFQFAFRKSSYRKLDSGGYLHFDLPRLYFHSEGFVSKQRLGHDTGLVYKFKNTVLTRCGAGVLGQAWGNDKITRETSYQIGPSIHFELLNNLIVRAALPYWGKGDGPKLIFSVTYAAGLWNDFK